MSDCPKCGCQVEDPFLGIIPIHDVSRCSVQPKGANPFTLDEVYELSKSSINRIMELEKRIYEARNLINNYSRLAGDDTSACKKWLEGNP